eukprot:g42473.t1
MMDIKEMADQLNKYFGSAFTEKDTNNLQEMLGDRGSSMKEELKEILISQEMVLRKLMRLKPDKSPESDAEHPRVLKEVVLEIADALVIIFQHSVDSGRVPIDWRVANRFENLWNSLCSEAVGASSLDIFKRELDVACVPKGIRGYGER